MSQLLSLEIENYRSFYKRQTLSFGSTNSRKVTALFGVNSGGKSNTARALMLVQHIIRNSASANWTLPYEPFLLRDGSERQPSFFKMSFVDGERYFTYEFGYCAEKIVFEELKERSANTQKMKTLFTRDSGGMINRSAVRFGFGITLAKKTRNETLLLTKAREDNNEYANIMFKTLDSIQVIQGDSSEISHLSIELFKQNPSLQKRTLELMKKCDFHIHGFEIDEQPISSEVIESLPFPDDFKRNLVGVGMTTVSTSHVVRDDERTVIGEKKFDFMAQESMGTKKFFEIAVPIVNALEHGTTLYIDEFGAFLNPVLSNAIVELFKARENDKGATLILNTHNTSIMSEAELMREEILFVEKTLGEESRIVSMVEKSVRKNESFEKRYRAGMYGATPIIRDRA